MENSSQDLALHAARAELYAGTVDDAGACDLLECSERTLERHVADGMPFLKWGARRRFVVASMREWLLTHERARSREPRKPGRPRKAR
jgi:hypothetical protein